MIATLPCLVPSAQVTYAVGFRRVHFQLVRRSFFMLNPPLTMRSAASIRRRANAKPRRFSEHLPRSRCYRIKSSVPIRRRHLVFP